MLFSLSVYALALVYALPQSTPAPRVKIELRQNNAETGGSFGCFGIDAIGSNRIRSILELSPASKVTFYSGFACDKATLVKTGAGIVVSQSAIGPVIPQIYYTDVRSIRISPIVS